MKVFLKKLPNTNTCHIWRKIKTPNTSLVCSKVDTSVGAVIGFLKITGQVGE
jgi:hypothetical protein